MVHRFIAKMWQAFAPRVCDDCEGGSGMVYNQQIGAVLRCATCAGTGVAQSPQSDSERRVADALAAPPEPSRSNPRSAA